MLMQNSSYFVHPVNTVRRQSVYNTCKLNTNACGLHQDVSAWEQCLFYGHYAFNQFSKINCNFPGIRACFQTLIKEAMRLWCGSDYQWGTTAPNIWTWSLVSGRKGGRCNESSIGNALVFCFHIPPSRSLWCRINSIMPLHLKFT